jgi:hypothetical protein
MVIKATVVLVVGGLTGSGLVALKSSWDESQPTAIERQEVAAPTDVITPQSYSDETNQLGYTQARFAAQRPFAAICAVSR